jgi:predicted site-specific integrase-resolvase
LAGGDDVSVEILTAEQLAERWQVDKTYVYRRTRSGEIPCIPLPGKVYRYRLDVIEAFERGEVDSNPKAA